MFASIFVLNITVRVGQKTGLDRRARAAAVGVVTTVTRLGHRPAKQQSARPSVQIGTSVFIRAEPLRQVIAEALRDDYEWAAAPVFYQTCPAHLAERDSDVLPTHRRPAWRDILPHSLLHAFLGV